VVNARLKLLQLTWVHPHQEQGNRQKYAEGDQMSRLVDALFGCRHKHCMFPITIRQPHSNQATNPPTYIVCLDCGKEFGYDWQKMKVGATVKHAA
jgi:hypothetical protein